MLIFSPIPEKYLHDMQRIERVSNPHPWLADSINDGYQQFEHLGAFLGDELIAFVFFRQVVDEAEIIHLVCEQTHQNKGYSRELLIKLKHQLQLNNVRKLFLEVREDNVAARRLYEKLDFVTVGRRANYYGGRHDALIQRVFW